MESKEQVTSEGMKGEREKVGEVVKDKVRRTREKKWEGEKVHNNKHDDRG